MSNYGNPVESGGVSIDQTQSGNGSSVRALRRMEIVYKDIDMVFAVNPSDYTQKEPNRVSIVQTKHGLMLGVQVL